MAYKLRCLGGALYYSRHADSASDMGLMCYQAEFQADNIHIIASFTAQMLADVLLLEQVKQRYVSHHWIPACIV